MRKTSLIFAFCAVFFSICLCLSAQTSPRTGDVNNDGQVNIVDALIIAQYSVGLHPAVFNADAADVNENGSIDIIDALLVAQYYVGIIREFPVTGGIVITKSDTQRNPSPQPASGELDAVATGINEFAFDCFARLKEKSEDGNIFFSPLSISFALAMCYAGSAGNTESQISQTMHFTLPQAALHNAYNALELALTAPPTSTNPMFGAEVELSMANSSWGQTGYNFLTPYLDTLAYHYDAGINLVDFKAEPENCRSLINNWVSEKTQNRINNLLPPQSISNGTRLVLTNAVYFKANWYYPFSELNTEEKPFYLLNGSSLTTPFMQKTLSLAYKEVAGEYQAVRLPYQGTRKFYMMIVLPAAGNFLSFENSLDLAAYTTLREGWSNYRVALSMPKFGFEWESSLKPALKSLGMTDAFDIEKADFTRISADPMESLYLSNILHKSFIAVDEKGTEASAATVVIATTSPAITPVPRFVTMTINRPFLFFIFGPTGSILFFGRLVTP